MIKNYDIEDAFENQEMVIKSKYGGVYRLKWKSRVIEFVTCGAENESIECLEPILPTLSIILRIAERGLEIPLSIEHFNRMNLNEQLDFGCNCHGFTFGNGMYWISNEFIDAILEQEFEEVLDESIVMDGKFDVVCLRDVSRQEWVHSCKHLFRLFVHKEGLRKFSAHANIDEVLSIPEYRHTEVHYFRRIQRSCPGICTTALNEVHSDIKGNPVIPHQQ